MADQKEIVKRILAGDKKAFGVLVTQNQRLVSHVVFRMIPSIQDREDICQDVFLKVYRHLGKFRFEAKLSTWIAHIAYTTCLNFLEKKKLPLYDDIGKEGSDFEPVGKDKDRPDRRFTKKEISRIVHDEIETMPPVYRTIITLYHLDHINYAEIGKIMNMPEGTVKSYLFRARKLLKEKLLTKFKREDL